jgi:outer membrane receptor protein involved in Fe transport
MIVKIKKAQFLLNELKPTLSTDINISKMKKSILLSMMLFFIISMSSLAQTDSSLSQFRGQNAITSNTLIKDQDTSSKNIRLRQYSFNTMKQIGPQPIIVIDGKVSDHGYFGITPNDIQSISVLKNEKASALYGDKNGAGVISIITKKKTNDIKVENPPNK